jgi:hypothetical protein
MSAITVYSFRVRDERSRKWRRARYKMTREHARVVYGERNYELIIDSAEVRQVNLGRSAARDSRAYAGRLRTPGRPQR